MRLTLTKDIPIRQARRVRFYLICYDGVRVIDADLESLSSGKDKDSDLLVAGMRVGTEFRRSFEAGKRDSTMTVWSKSLQATRDGGSSSASRVHDFWSRVLRSKRLGDFARL